MHVWFELLLVVFVVTLLTNASPKHPAAGWLRLTLTPCLKLMHSILYSCSTAFCSLVLGLHLHCWQAQ